MLILTLVLFSIIGVLAYIAARWESDAKEDSKPILEVLDDKKVNVCTISKIYSEAP